MKEKYFKLVFIILVSILLLSAIYIYVFKQNEKVISTSKLKSNKTEKIISNNIRIGIIEFDNINPILSNNKNVQDVSKLIFEPLITLTEDYNLEGVLAKEWSKISEKTYIIKLKENVLWHDGKKFESSDVVFTINAIKELKQDSIYYHNVKNILEVQKIDEYTIKIITDIDISYFEYNLIFPIISSKEFNIQNLKLESKNKSPVGTGMFYICDVNNEDILLKKNTENIKSKGLKLETITLKLYNSLANTIKAYKAEEIDLFTTSNQNVEDYLKHTKYNFTQYINRNYNYIALNCENRILSNIEVRQAINYAINKEEIFKNVFYNTNQISNFPLDFGSFTYDINNSIIASDTNKAKKILIENGWRYSEDGWKKDNHKLELDIIVKQTNQNNIKVANSITEQLSKIGIVINVKDISEKEYNNYLQNKNYDLILVNETYGYSPSLEKYFGTNNLANYQNVEINTILKETQLLNNEEEIKQKYSRICKIYNEEVPYISLYFETNTIIYSQNLKGTIAPNSYNLFYAIENWYREYDVS